MLTPFLCTMSISDSTVWPSASTDVAAMWVPSGEILTILYCAWRARSAKDTGSASATHATPQCFHRDSPQQIVEKVLSLYLTRAIHGARPAGRHPCRRHDIADRRGDPPATGSTGRRQLRDHSIERGLPVGQCDAEGFPQLRGVEHRPGWTLRPGRIVRRPDR